MNTWKKQREHIKKQGGRSDGLYNVPKRTQLSDNPTVGETKTEMIKAYIERYREEKGRNPSYTHLNKEFNIRATKKYYEELME
ncbi:hypothetical protein P2W49_07210 [Yersinia intermedia]|nr:hypothetical protein P2W49_07210 [Yersinia intermedia]